jgi:hypothetical protein
MQLEESKVGKRPSGERQRRAVRPEARAGGMAGSSGESAPASVKG